MKRPDPKSILVPTHNYEEARRKAEQDKAKGGKRP